jgi:hypothetical protein
MPVKTIQLLVEIRIATNKLLSRGPHESQPAKNCIIVCSVAGQRQIVVPYLYAIDTNTIRPSRQSNCRR